MTTPGEEYSAAPRRRTGSGGARLRTVLLVGIGILYIVSVPWYRATDSPFELLLGLPDWATVAVLCYAAAAVLNCLAWMRTEVDDEAPLAPTLTRPGDGPRVGDESSGRHSS